MDLYLTQHHDSCQVLHFAPHLQAKVKNEIVTRCGQGFVSHWCYVISQAARVQFPGHAVPQGELGRLIAAGKLLKVLLTETAELCRGQNGENWSCRGYLI